MCNSYRRRGCDRKKTYIVCVSETFRKAFKVIASSEEEAREIVDENNGDGEYDATTDCEDWERNIDSVSEDW